MKNKILIVDDDVDSSIIQQSITQKLGYYTQIAINGIDAIKFIKQDPPDIILLDIFMPEMDGYETIEYLGENFDIPIIVVTAGGNQAIKKIKEMGILFYIQKPIVPNKLQREIYKCIKYHENKKDKDEN
jgi:CheY-like chemotaxis protein